MLTSNFFAISTMSEATRAVPGPEELAKLRFENVQRVLNEAISGGVLGCCLHCQKPVAEWPYVLLAKIKTKLADQLFRKGQAELFVSHCKPAMPFRLTVALDASNNVALKSAEAVTQRLLNEMVAGKDAADETNVSLAVEMAKMRTDHADELAALRKEERLEFQRLLRELLSLAIDVDIADLDEVPDAELLSIANGVAVQTRETKAPEAAAEAKPDPVAELCRSIGVLGPADLLAKVALLCSIVELTGDDAASLSAFTEKMMRVQEEAAAAQAARDEAAVERMLASSNLPTSEINTRPSKMDGIRAFWKTLNPKTSADQGAFGEWLKARRAAK